MILLFRLKLTGLLLPKPPNTTGSQLASGDVYLKCWGDTGESNSYVLEDCVFYGQSHLARIHNDGSDGESKTITDCLFSCSLDWNTTLNVGGGVVCTTTITGTQSPEAGDLTQCTAIIGSGWHGIWGSGANNTLSIDNTLVYVDDDNGRGISFVDGGAFSIADSSFYSTYLGLLINSSNSDTIDSTTIVAPGVSAIEFFGTSTGDLTITDSIIAGAGGTDISGALPAGGVAVSNSGYASEGADALASIGAAGQVDTDVVMGDPLFLSKDPSAATYLDVDSAFYGGAAAGGADLAGGGTYVGWNTC